MKQRIVTTILFLFILFININHYTFIVGAETNDKQVIGHKNNYLMSDYRSDFGKDEKAAKTYVETKYKEIEKKLSRYELNHIEDLTNENSALLKKINSFLDKQISEDWLEKMDYLDDIKNTDEIFQEKVSKSNVRHTFYMNLNFQELGFRSNEYLDNQNRIDLEKFASFIDQFQYFNFNGNLIGSLSQSKLSTNERIRLRINVPINTRILFLEDGSAILDRDIGLIVNRISLFSEGRQYIGMDVDVVSKEDIRKEIESDEIEINKILQSHLSIDRSDLVEINAKSLISNYTALKAKESIQYLIKVIPSDIFIQAIKAKNKGDFKINFSDKISDDDDTDGYYDANKNMLHVRIICDDDDSELDTLVHEFGHSVDYNILGQGEGMHSLNSSLFTELFVKEKGNLTEVTSGIVAYDEAGNGITYGSVNPAEFFAEVFKNMYSSDLNKEELIWRQVPETCQYIASQISEYTNAE